MLIPPKPSHVTESSDDVPLPFSFLFTMPALASPGPADTISDTPGQTSTDGKIDDDTIDDEDVDDGTFPNQTGLIADSNSKEDDDY